MLRGSLEWLCRINRPACKWSFFFWSRHSDRVSAVILTSANMEHTDWPSLSSRRLPGRTLLVLDLHLEACACFFFSSFSLLRSHLADESRVSFLSSVGWAASGWILCACVGSAPLKRGGPKQKGCTLEKKKHTKQNQACARGVNNHPSQREPQKPDHRTSLCPVVLLRTYRLWDREEQPTFSPLVFLSFILASSAALGQTKTWLDLPVLSSRRWPPTGDWQLPSIVVDGNLTSCWWSRWVWLFEASC